VPRSENKIPWIIIARSWVKTPARWLQRAGVYIDRMIWKFRSQRMVYNRHPSKWGNTDLGEPSENSNVSGGKRMDKNHPLIELRQPANRMASPIIKKTEPRKPSRTDQTTIEVWTAWLIRASRVGWIVQYGHYFTDFISRWPTAVDNWTYGGFSCGV